MIAIELVVTFQELENYALMDWDGRGDRPFNWKPKGAFVKTESIQLDHFSHHNAIIKKRVAEIVAYVEGANNHHRQRHFVGHEVVRETSVHSDN